MDTTEKLAALMRRRRICFAALPAALVLAMIGAALAASESPTGGGFVGVGVAIGVLSLVYLIVDIPYAIALRRGNPQADMVRALAWLGVLLGGLLWVAALVWAYYTPSRRD